jgi:gamma-glutamyltranspeptidase
VEIKTGRPPSLATNGMVTCPHSLASQAGVDVLRAGGSAVDAAIFLKGGNAPRAGARIVNVDLARTFTIDAESGVRNGGSDPRSDGAAIGY